MTPSLIVNENFPAPATWLLRSKGVDLISVQETMQGASDEMVLAKASETGSWLVTFDRDYGELVFSRKCPPPRAIIYLRQEPIPPTEPAKWVLELLAEPNEVDGYLVVVGQHTVRRRPLPKSLT